MITRLQPINCMPVHCIGSPSAAMKSCRVVNHLRALCAACSVLHAARRARMMATAARAVSRERVSLFCVTVIFFILFCVVGTACAAPWLVYSTVAPLFYC